MDPFQPRLTTPRLHLRPFVPDDVHDLQARRDDPEVARYQRWSLPFGFDAARTLVAHLVHEPTEPDGWRMLVVEDRASGATVGDVALHPTSGGMVVDVGYTLARAHWGHGYATEALDAVVGHLFDAVGVGRVGAQLHPDNVASARVLERVGFLHEGRTADTCWSEGGASDDLLYGLTRRTWVEWRTRPRTEPTVIDLVEVTPENRSAVLDLRTHHSQRRLVSPMGKSFADALVPDLHEGHAVVPWYRAVEADGAVAAFVMVAAPTDHHPEPYLWRLLVDRGHQRRGIGRRAVGLVVDQVRSWGADVLEVSWCDGPGSPRPFYEGLGFVPTGRIVEGEVEARLELT